MALYILVRKMRRPEQVGDRGSFNFRTDTTGGSHSREILSASPHGVPRPLTVSEVFTFFFVTPQR